ncbi:MAG: helix-turn-helix domain-containing protein [Bacteroidaceae bacterium]|nr:helix-turn-helix domain-containing protein [Bacteroidaceae bacterium]
MLDESIILSIFVAGISTIILAGMAYTFLKPGRNTPQKQFGALCAVWGMIMAMAPLYELPALVVQPKVILIMRMSGFLIMAALKLFFVSLVLPRRITKFTIFLNYLPFATFPIVAIFWFNAFYFNMVVTVTAFYGLFNIARVSYVCINYKSYLKIAYSEIENRDVTWVLAYMTALLFLFSFYAWLMVNPGVLNDLLFRVVVIVMLGSISYLMIRQRENDAVESLIEEELFGKERHFECDQYGKTVYPFVENFEKLMRDNEPFLVEGVKVDDIARLINADKYLLMDYFKNGLKTTFYDYIRERRMEKAYELLVDPTCRMTIDAISRHCGFNNITAFREAFSRVYHKNPTEVKYGVLV